MKLDPYEIASSIGAGGMGEVFRARDTRLNRDVAMKPAKHLASESTPRHGSAMRPKTKRRPDSAAQIYRQLAGARGLDDDELWQHALFFAMSPQQRCHFSLQTARSALSLRRSVTRK